MRRPEKPEDDTVKKTGLEAGKGEGLMHSSGTQAQQARKTSAARPEKRAANYYKI